VERRSDIPTGGRAGLLAGEGGLAGGTGSVGPDCKPRRTAAQREPASREIAALSRRVRSSISALALCLAAATRPCVSGSHSQRRPICSRTKLRAALPNELARFWFRTPHQGGGLVRLDRRRPFLADGDIHLGRAAALQIDLGQRRVLESEG
jgi:hypothetical protein